MRLGASRVENEMTLLLYYIVLVAVLDVAAIALCLMVEQVFPALSMPIFLILFFGILWLAWIISVRLTEPRSVSQPVAGPAE